MTVSTQSTRTAAHERRLALIRRVHGKLYPKVTTSLGRSPLGRLHDYALKLKQAKVSNADYRTLMLKAQTSLRKARQQTQQACKAFNGDFGFSSLPGELRNRILELALYEHRELPLLTFRCPSLALVSHGMRREAVPAFFAVNNFHIVFLKKVDGTGYETGIPAETITWLQTIHTQSFGDMDFAEFMRKVVLVKHLSFAFVNKPEDVDSPRYRESRIDYDFDAQDTKAKHMNATRSVEKTKALLLPTLSSAPVVEILRMQEATKRRKFHTSQLQRNILVNEWFKLFIRAHCPNGLSLGLISNYLTRFPPPVMLRSLLAKSAELRNLCTKPELRTYLVCDVMAC